MCGETDGEVLIMWHNGFDWSVHDRMHQVTGKELKMGNRTMWSIGHMPNLQCGTGLIV